jgi:hypothetical protein
MVFTNASEIENLMAQVSQSYRSQGIASTRPEIEHIGLLTENLASVDVRWPSFDRSGKEKASEVSHYILHIGKEGKARIRVALTEDESMRSLCGSRNRCRNLRDLVARLSSRNPRPRRNSDPLFVTT